MVNYLIVYRKNISKSSGQINIYGDQMLLHMSDKSFILETITVAPMLDSRESVGEWYGVTHDVSENGERAEYLWKSCHDKLYADCFQ